MRRYTTEALSFIVGVTLLAGASTWAGLTAGGPPPSWVTFGLLSALAAAAHLYPIRSARDGVVYGLSNVFIYAGVMLLPADLVALQCTLALVPLLWRQWTRPGALTRFSFNAAQSVLAAEVAWLILRRAHAAGAGSLREVLWLFASVVCFTAVQTVCVGCIVALNSRMPLSRVEGINLNGFLGDALLPFLGTLMAQLWQFRPSLLFLIVPPVMVIYRLMRDIQLVRAADLDAKTGLYNSRFFEQSMTQELGRSRFIRRPVSVIFVDMDYLREVNNTYGHLGGDKAIQHVAVLMQQELPKSSVIARFGGEEFVALLAGTDPDEAEFLAWRLCKAIARQPVELGDSRSVGVTVSIGVAAYPQHGTSVAQVVHAADQAVYQAKGRGRNRVINATSLSPQQLRMAEGGAFPAAPAAPAGTPTPAPAEVTDAAPAPAPARPPGPTAPLPADPAPALRAGLQPRQDPDPLVISYIIAFISMAALAFIGIVPERLRLTPGPVLLIIAAVACGELVKVMIRTEAGEYVPLSLTTAVMMASAVMAGPGGAVLACLTGVGTRLILARERDWYQVVFRMGIGLVSAVATGWLMLLVPHPAPGANLKALHALIPVVAAALHFALFNIVRVLLISRQTRIPYKDLLIGRIRAYAPLHTAIGTLGAYTAMGFLRSGPWGAVMFTLPILAIFLAYRNRLERVRGEVAALERTRSQLEQIHLLQKESLDKLVLALSRLIDARDASVCDHSLQVARYSAALARDLGLGEGQVEQIYQAGLLHDLGKLGIPEGILHKPGRLTPEEWEVMRTHAELGRELLQSIPQLRDVAVMVGDHHEQFSGRGYPAGKQGQQISLGGRILAVADALDCILSDRPYSKARSVDWALSEMERCAGSHFDPTVVAALRRIARREGPGFFAVNSSPAGATQDRAASM